MRGRRPDQEVVIQNLNPWSLPESESVRSTNCSVLRLLMPVRTVETLHQDKALSKPNLVSRLVCRFTVRLVHPTLPHTGAIPSHLLASRLAARDHLAGTRQSIDEHMRGMV